MNNGSSINLSSKDKQKLMQYLNKQGFILEERLYKLLSDLKYIRINDKNKVFEYKGEEGEIDITASIEENNLTFEDKINLIFECKKTNFSWLFPMKITNQNFFTLLKKANDGFYCHESKTENIVIADSGVGISFDDTEKLENVNKSDIRESQQVIHKSVRQLLKNFNFFINQSKVIGYRFYPVLVTNAELLVIDYATENINSRGDLIDYGKMLKVDFLIYNHPYIMRWDNESQEFKYSLIKIKNKHIKSVFIVNINKIDECLKYITNIKIYN